MSATVSLTTCDNIFGSNGKQFIYATSLMGSQLVTEVCKNLQMAEAKNLRLLLRISKETLIWISPTENLAHYNPINGSILYILKSNITVDLVTPDGSNKKILIDITKTVKELVQLIADKLKSTGTNILTTNMNNSVGYALYRIDKSGTQIPLDINQSLPEQCENYEKLLIKRRYFVFTKTQLKNQSISVQIFNDVLSNMEGKWALSNISLEQQADLLYYQLYSKINASPDEVKPSSIPQNVTPNVRNLVTSYLETRSPPQTKEESISQYLSIASQINGFGCERYNVKWSTNNNTNQAQNGMLVAGIKNVEILNAANNSIALSFSYSKFISLIINQTNVNIKVTSENKTEYILNIWCESPLIAVSLKTLITGYAALYHDYGSELAVDGFSKETIASTADTEILKGISLSSFSKYYLYNQQTNKYIFYPGTIGQFQRTFEPLLSKIQSINPTISEDIAKNLQIVKSDPVNQEAILNLTFDIENLFSTDPTTSLITGTAPTQGFNQIVDKKSLECSLFSLSTINITVSGLEVLYNDVVSLLSCQKIIRNEILLRLDVTWKAQVNGIVKALKTYKTFLSESINSMKQNPADGTLLYQIQCKLIEIDLYLNNMFQFIDSFSKFSPGTPYFATIDKFKKHLREVLRPLIPRETNDRIAHLIKLYTLMLSLSIVIAIGNEFKQDQSIISNSELHQKLTESLSNLILSYSKAQESKKDLTIRPLSIRFLDIVKNDLSEVRRDLQSMKGIAETVSSLSNNPLFNQSVLYSISLLNSCLHSMESLKTEPYRDAPTQQQLKQLHDSSIEFLQKFMKHSSNLKDQRSRDLYNNANESTVILKTLVQVLKQAISNPNKTIFGIIIKTKSILVNTVHVIRELSSLLSDSSLYQSFTKISNTIDEVLTIKTPTFGNLQMNIKEMISIVQSEMHEIVAQQVITDCLKVLTSSNFPDREVLILQTMQSCLTPQLNDVSNPDRAIRLKKAFDSIQSVINCINQLPITNVYQLPRINLVPFFKGKETNVMIQEFIPQLDTIAKVFHAFKSIPFFGSQKKFSTVIDFWERYFADCTLRIPQLKDDLICLLAKLREALKKRPQISIFCLDISKYVSDFDKFNKQIDTFFENIDILVEGLSKPVIQSDDSQAFVEDIQPKVSNLQQLLLNIEIASNKVGLNEKIRQLQQLLTASNITQMNTSQLQQFADSLYQNIQDILVIDSDNINYIEKSTKRSLNPTLTASSMNLLNSLAAFTEISSKDTNVKKVYSSVVPSKAIQQISSEIINGISINLNNGIQQQQMTQLETLFSRYTSDPSSLSSSNASASIFIRSQTVKIYPYDALRVLICSQTNKKFRLEQLKNMTIMFSIAAAQLIIAVIPFIEEIKAKPPTQKALFYATYLLRSIEGFDSKILLESRNFQSVAFTYASLRDIRTSLSLLLTEPSLNQTLSQYATNFLSAIDQADTSLSLYYANSIDNLLSECLYYYISTNNEEKQTLINTLINYIESPSLQIGPNYNYLSKLSKELPIIERDISSTEAFTDNDPYVKDIINNFSNLKEFKLINHYWTNPLSETDSILFWMNAFSDLTLSQSSLGIIKSIYTKDILKTPLLFVRPSSLLTSLQILCESNNDDQVKSIPSTEKVASVTNEILNQYGFLGSDTKNYKGDTKLQELIPQLFTLFDSLVKEITSLKEPDYQKLPLSDKLLGVTTLKQLGMILAQAEHTPIYDETKEIIDYLKSQSQSQSLNQSVAATYAKTLNMLPSFIDLPLKDTIKELSDSLTSVFKNLSDQQIPLDNLLSGFPNLLASMIKYLSTLNEKARKILNIKAVFFLQTLQKLSTATGNDSVINRALLQNQLVQLSYFMNLKNQILKNEDIEKNSSTETNNLITYISNNDRNKLAVTLMNLRAYQALAANRDFNIDLLNEIDEVLTTLLQNQQTNTLTPQQLGEQRDKLLVYFSNDTIKLAKLISSKNDVDSLIELRSDMKLVAQFTPTSSDSLQPQAALSSIYSLISIASNVQLLSHRGLELVPNLSSNFVFEYIDTYFMSIHALNNFIEKQSKSDLRMFRRFVDNNGDLIDDLSLDGSSFEEQIGFAGLKSQFVTACANVLASLSTLNVAFSNTQLMNTFHIVLSREVPKMTERANYLITSAKTMIDTNTLKELNTSFINATNVFHGQISSFVQNLQKATETTIIKIEHPLVESIHSLASIANSMNDEVPISYEPEQANKLPQKFSLPSVDNAKASQMNLKPQDVARSALNVLKQVNINEYTNYMASMPPNSPLVETTLKLYEQFKTCLSSCLLVSTRSVNLQNKLDLVDNSNSLVNSINNLNKGIRNKCLGSPNWLRDSQRALKEISDKLNAFVPLCEDAIKSADNEEKTIGEIHNKIFSVLNPLHEKITAIESIADYISKNLPATPNREFAITLCDLIGKGSTILSNLLLYAKDHPKEITDLDDCIQKASQMITLINQVAEAFGYTKDMKNIKLPSIEELSQFNQDISGLLNAITKHLSFASTSSDAEALKMKEQLKIICKGIETLGVAITQSPDYGAQGQSKFNSPEAQQRLMTRLELESSVIRYRYKLEFLENQMVKFQ